MEATEKTEKAESTNGTKKLVKVPKKTLKKMRARAAAKKAPKYIAPTSVRRAGKKPAPKKSGAKMGRPAKWTGTKADFIRQNMHLDTKEVLKLAKQQGVSFSPKLIYVYRSAEKKAKADKKLAKQGAAFPKVHSGLAAITAFKNELRSKMNGGPEDLLRAVAAELGLANALTVLKNERQRIFAALGETSFAQAS